MACLESLPSRNWTGNVRSRGKDCQCEGALRCTGTFPWANCLGGFRVRVAIFVWHGITRFVSDIFVWSFAEELWCGLRWHRQECLCYLLLRGVVAFAG